MIVEPHSHSRVYSPKRLQDEESSFDQSNFRMKKKSGLFSLLFSCRQRRHYQDEDIDNATCTAPLMSDEDLSISHNPYYNNASSESSSMSQPGSPKQRRSDDSDTQMSEAHSKEEGGESLERTKLLNRWKSRLSHCLTGARKGDTKSNHTEKSPLSHENKIPAMASSDDEDSSMQSGNKLEASAKSAFSTVEKASNSSTSSVYPTQERRNAPNSQVALYPYTVEIKSFHPSTAPPLSNDSTGFLAVSIDDECAQLVVQSSSAFDDDDASADTSSLLGISFPHPAGHGCTLEPCLGVSSGHPNWLYRQMDDIWRTVDSDLMEGELTAPPSPTPVETMDSVWSHDDISMLPEDEDHTMIPPENTFFSAVYNPIRSMAREMVISCGGDALLDAELADIHDVPFDELDVDRKVTWPRIGIDPNMMMLSQMSECGSIVQPYLDDESLSGDGWTDYNDAVSDIYSSMLDDVPSTTD